MAELDIKCFRLEVQLYRQAGDRIAQEKVGAFASTILVKALNLRAPRE